MAAVLLVQDWSDNIIPLMQEMEEWSDEYELINPKRASSLSDADSVISECVYFRLPRMCKRSEFVVTAIKGRLNLDRSERLLIYQRYYKQDGRIGISCLSSADVVDEILVYYNPTGAGDSCIRIRVQIPSARDDKRFETEMRSDTDKNLSPSGKKERGFLNLFS